MSVALAAMGGTWSVADFDWIVVNTSAGKDSQALLDVVCKLAAAHGVLGRVVAVHCDLGRVEWEGTLELAREQAAHYGVRFEVVSRIGGIAKKDSSVYKAGETYGDLLDYVERRGKWPDSATRYCTSEFKRGPVQKLHTRLAKEWRDGVDLQRRITGTVAERDILDLSDEAKARQKRPCRILNCMGMRAQESPARAKLEAWATDEAISNGRKVVFDWLPLHAWSEDEVWRQIRLAGTRHHRAYDLGMPRLSCAFCIFATERALMIAGEHNPQLLREYVRVEEKTGHTFKRSLALRVIQDRLDAGERVRGKVDDDGCWNM